MADTFRARATRVFWKRHANPWSGWTRTLTLPVLVYAVFTRRWRLLVAGVVYSVVNPVLFSPPESADAWMTKVVLAERRWRETSDDLGSLHLLNAGNAVATLYAFYAASRRDAGGATAGTSLAMTLKFAFVAALVRRYEEELETVDAP